MCKHAGIKDPCNWCANRGVSCNDCIHGERVCRFSLIEMREETRDEEYRRSREKYYTTGEGEWDDVPER